MDDERIVEKIAKDIESASGGPIKKVLWKYWNTLHDLEADLEEVSKEYDIAASYGGDGGKDAKNIYKQIKEMVKKIEYLSFKEFALIEKAESNFVRKHGTPEEYADETSRSIFPR